MFGKLSIFGSIKVSNYPLLLNAELSKSIKSTKKYGKYTFKIFSIDIVFQIDMTLNINYILEICVGEPAYNIFLRHQGDHVYI